MSRTFSDILIEADYTNDIWALNELRNEILNNKYDYPLVQLWFAKEHFDVLSKRLAQKHAKKFSETLENLGLI